MRHSLWRENVERGLMLSTALHRFALALRINRASAPGNQQTHITEHRDGPILHKSTPCGHPREISKLQPSRISGVDVQSAEGQGYVTRQAFVNNGNARKRPLPAESTHSEGTLAICRDWGLGKTKRTTLSSAIRHCQLLTCRKHSLQTHKCRQGNSNVSFRSVRQITHSSGTSSAPTASDSEALSPGGC